MSEITFTPGKRQDASLIIGIAGPSGGGKTLSALKLAKGLAQGGPIAAIDTERGRMLHYADDFDFLHAALDAPFSPSRYSEAIRKAEAINPAVILIDSFSHEHAGEGGVLDMHEAELERMAGDDYKRREAMKFAAWIKPKAERKRLVQHLLQLNTHLIVCLRAEEKIEIAKENGKTVVKPMRTLAGHVGWIPVAAKELPYELTISLVVTPDAPGVPKPIKLSDQHRALVPLNKPLTEDVGAALAEWARGSTAKPTTGADPESAWINEQERQAVADALELAHRVSDEAHTLLTAGVEKNRAENKGAVKADWLARQVAALEKKLPAESSFKAPAGALK